MATVDFLSRLAFSEAQTAIRLTTSEMSTDLVLQDDRIEDAVFYVEQGFRQLTEISSWDPYTNARASAEDTVVIYAKVRLMGMNPDSSQEFLTALKRWQRAASLTGNETGDKGTTNPVTFASRRKRSYSIRR